MISVKLIPARLQRLTVKVFSKVQPTCLLKMDVTDHSQNPSDKKDCEIYETEFREKIARRCPNLDLDNIEVKHCGFQVNQDGTDESASKQHSKDDDKLSNTM